MLNCVASQDKGFKNRMSSGFCENIAPDRLSLHVVPLLWQMYSIWDQVVWPSEPVFGLKCFVVRRDAVLKLGVALRACVSAP